MASKQPPIGATPIKMKDMTSFKWMLLNIIGHDFMHDFLLNTARTEKGSHKGVNLLDYLNKTIRSASKLITKGKKNTTFIRKLIEGQKGGGNNMKGGAPQKGKYYFVFGTSKVEDGRIVKIESNTKNSRWSISYYNSQEHG